MSVVIPWYRLGFLVPHLHVDMGPYQFYKVAPDGVMFVTSHWHLREYSLAAIEEQLDSLWRGVDVLAGQNVDRLVVGGVPVAAALGRDRMRALLSDVTSRTGVASDNDLEAHIAALGHLGVRDIALATRWPQDVNDALVSYLEQAGITVSACVFASRNLAQNTVAVPEDDHQLLLRLGREALASTSSAGALLMPGGLGFVIHAARILEAENQLPVLVNATSTLWAALRAHGTPLPHEPDPAWSGLLAGLRTEGRPA